MSTVYVTRLDDGTFSAILPSLPGCAANAKTRDEAVERCREVARAYIDLLRERDVRIEHDVFDPERLEVRDAPEPNTVPEDFTPVEEHDLRDFLHRFEALHAALVDRVADMTQEVLQHVASTEIGLLSRLEPWPRGGFGTFNAVRRIVVQRFSVMDAGDAQGEHTILGRRWTAKKVARRLLEHAFEHLRQADEILEKLKTRA